LGEIAEIDTGNKNRQDAVDDGKYPFYVRSKDVYRINSYSFDEEAIIIPGEGGIGDIFHYVNEKYDLHQRAYRVHFITSDINTKYAFYYLQVYFKDYIMNKAVAATVTSIRKPMLQGFPIAFPPLAEQARIVAILDKFEALTTSLSDGIPAEQALQQKRYEYYRDLLLTFEKRP
jgi:type I restriction enzyme S subunit